MSLGMLMTALAEYVGDALVNDCGRPVPDRVLRYHGIAPDDCCTEAGTLALSWSDGRASSDFPASAANQRNDPCSQRPLYEIAVRYKVCWPVPDVDQGGVALRDTEWDETAAMLADTADCVTRALIRLSCHQPGVQVDSFNRAVLNQVAGRWLRYVATSPIVPSGGCAGVLWRITAAPLPGPVS